MVSLDGLAYHIWRDDPAARELRSLRQVASRGVVARGMVQAFPTITPAGHASLYTGAYGNVSGVVTSWNPMLPRSEHTAFDRLSGYDSRLLQAEPLWVTSARQGIATVAHHSTQNYPFIPFITAPDAATPPVLVSGYGPAKLADHAVIRKADTTAEEASEWSPRLPASALPVRAFRWTKDRVTFHGALVAERGAAQGYTALYVAADPGGERVRVASVSTETVFPRGRELARYFSEPLRLRVGEKRVPTVAYFRLFELAPDGSEFMLFQPAVYELGLYEGPKAASDAPDKTVDEAGVVYGWQAPSNSLEKMLGEAGGFLGNGPSYLYRDGLLGKQLNVGGDGTAERRYLEGIELVIRQYNRQSAWVVKHYNPRLLIDYSPYPDEMEHALYGLTRPDVTGVDRGVARQINDFRRWGYAVVDTRVALLDSIAGPRGHIVFTSDHGMSPAFKDVKVNVALKQAGLLALDDKGQIDPQRTQAVHLKYCVLVNTKDWRGGIVPLEDRKKVVDKIEHALGEVRDPETNRQVFTGFFRPEEHGDKLGIGGPAGGDLYFELAPGYKASDATEGKIIALSREMTGEHGYLSTRPEMLASFIARGPRIKRGTIPTVRSIDVAAFVSDLLGIKPPAQNRGKSPLFK